MRAELVGPEEFERLLLGGARFIDVRSEIEFERGAIPGAVNLPILSTAEREQVGTCYKRQGQEAAIALGHRLVSGEIKAGRIARWCAVLAENPDALVYCWRGGLRSRLASEWIAAAGVPVPPRRGRLQGAAPPAAGRDRGAAAARAAVRDRRAHRLGQDRVDPLAARRDRPRGLRAAPWLELRPACRRTAGAGRFREPLALALLRRRHEAPGAALFLEDESRQIGAITLPLEVYRAMKAAPLVVVDAPFEARVGQIRDEYVCGDLREQLARDPEHGFARFGAALHESLARIARRLGGERHARAEGLMHEALHRHAQHDDPCGHRGWIELLLRDYYDPMYDYQLGKAADRIVFRGDAASVREWCLSR